MLGEFLSPLLLISVIGSFVVALYLAWAMLSFINSLRRIADSLEKLVRKLDPIVEKTGSEKEWIFEQDAGGTRSGRVRGSPRKGELL